MNMKLNWLIILSLLLINVSCKKEDLQPITSKPSLVQFNLLGNNAQVTWETSGDDYTDFTIELSKVADFSILDETKTTSTKSVIVRNLNPGGVYYARVKANKA